MKTIITKIAVLVTMLLLSTTASAYDFEVDGMYFNITDSTKHELEFTYKEYPHYNNLNSTYKGEINIPIIVWYKNKPYIVTSIGERAFYFSYSLTAITIPNTVKTIGDDAFNECYNLKSVIIPNSVTTIGNRAFSGCTSLNTVTIGNSVTTIGNSAFNACTNLSSVNIPNSVTTIGYYAFSTCDITNLIIPNSVTTIGEYAFSYTNLESITLPNSITTISNGTFYFCPGLKSITIPESVTTIGEYAFFECSRFESLTIPNSVTTIGGGAFMCCRDLKRLTIGENVTYIGNNAFGDKPWLEPYLLPKVFWLCKTPPKGDSVGNFGINYVPNNEYKFRYQKVYPYINSRFEVDNVIYVPVSPDDKTCDVVDCNYKPTSTEITIDSIVDNNGIEMKVMDINNYAFYRNTAITRLNISCNGDIGMFAFSENTSLTEINLHDKISNIGMGCFEDCRSLKSAMIGKGISTLPWRLFQNCSSLSFITIPNTVTEIENSVFAGCTNLSKVVFEESDAFNNLPIRLGSNGSYPLFSGCKLDEVYIGRKLLYETDDYIHLHSPFSHNETIRKVTFTDAETQIYDKEFFRCINLQEFECGDGVTDIGDMAFGDCYSLKSFISGTSVKTIGREAFLNCNALTYFTSNAKTPPVCEYQALDGINKTECKLYVPSESIADYKAAEQWKEFFFIEESGVDNITIDEGNEPNLPKEVYNINGIKVGNSVDGLPAGMYIIRQGKKVEKVMVH